MNSYKTKVERSIKEEKKLAKHRQEKQESNKDQNFLRKLSNILCLVLKLKEVQGSSQVLANLLSQWLVSCPQSWLMQRYR